MIRPPLCSCDGTRHDRHSERCPPPTARPTVTAGLEILNTHGQWVSAPAAFKPGVTYIIRARNRSTTP
jgi:hypothetical protein